MYVAKVATQYALVLFFRKNEYKLMHIDIFIHTPTLLCALFWLYLSLQCQNYCFICICLRFSELLLQYDCTPIRRGSGGGLKQQLMKLQNFYHNPGATYIEMQSACFRLCCNLYMSGNFDSLPLWSLNVKSGCALSCQICLNMALTFFFITGSWLCDNDDQDSKKLSPAGYCLFSCPRQAISITVI